MCMHNVSTVIKLLNFPVNCSINAYVFNNILTINSIEIYL